MESLQGQWAMTGWWGSELCSALLLGFAMHCGCANAPQKHFAGEWGGPPSFACDDTAPFLPTQPLVYVRVRPPQLQG